jgi:hypothetical protein
VIKAKGEQLHGYDLQLLAMSYAQLGRDAEAREAAVQRMQKEPDYSAERELGEEGDFAPAAAANRELYLEGLRKAGLPVCATAEQLAKYRASSACRSARPSGRGRQQPDRKCPIG